MRKKKRETQDYLIRGVPVDLWREVKSIAALKGVTLRQFLINLLAEELGRTETERRFKWTK